MAETIQKAISHLKSSTPSEHSTGIFAPGEDYIRFRAEHDEQGIFVDDDIWKGNSIAIKLKPRVTGAFFVKQSYIMQAKTERLTVTHPFMRRRHTLHLHINTKMETATVE